MLLLIFAISVLATTTAAAQENYFKQPQYEQRPVSGRYPSRPAVPIVSESNEINPDGSFSYSYVSADGSQAQAQGYLKNAGQKDKEAEVIQGSYSYTAPDGTPITVNWIADEYGFRAEGAHLPTPPPVPALDSGPQDRTGQYSARTGLSSARNRY